MKGLEALNRRDLLFGIATSAALPGGARARAAFGDPADQLRAVERAAAGRLGVFVLDTRTGRSFGWRAKERFCHCSTFKLSLAAMALREADAGRLDLTEKLAFGQADIIEYSPVVGANLHKGNLPILQLAEAVQVTSDNAAANLLLRRLGGPAALTRFWRELGDKTSRLDGYEPAINVIPSGTQENSTTPMAMAATLRRIVLGNVLSLNSRDLLLGWMAATRTGMQRIRAGLPTGWHCLDKTGTGMRPGIGNKTNDIAVVFPTGGRGPLIVTCYFENPQFRDQVRPEDEAVIKAVGAVAAGWKT